MAPPLVLVTDTNIWIDLENGGILADVFKLPYQFLIPDFAIRFSYCKGAGCYPFDR
jgi:hypothetical protein